MNRLQVYSVKLLCWVDEMYAPYATIPLAQLTYEAQNVVRVRGPTLKSLKKRIIVHPKVRN
jgi:hypothetical protein